MSCIQELLFPVYIYAKTLILHIFPNLVVVEIRLNRS